jgi:hypothetical protein
MYLFLNANLANQLNTTLSKFGKICYRHRSRLPADLGEGQAGRDHFMKENPWFLDLLEKCDEPTAPTIVQGIRRRIAEEVEAQEQEALKAQRLHELNQQAEIADRKATQTKAALRATQMDIMAQDMRDAERDAAQKREALNVEMNAAQKQETLKAAPAELPAQSRGDSAAMEEDAVPMEMDEDAVPTETDALPMQKSGALLLQTPTTSDQAAQEVLDSQGDMEGEFVCSHSLIISAHWLRDSTRGFSV